MTKYDFLIVGAGFFGAVCARKLTDAGFKCIIIEKENTVVGLSRDEIKDNILIHKSGEHVLYTDDSDIWDFLNKYNKKKRHKHQSMSLNKNIKYNIKRNVLFHIFLYLNNNFYTFYLICMGMVHFYQSFYYLLQ